MPYGLHQVKEWTPFNVTKAVATGDPELVFYEYVFAHLNGRFRQGRFRHGRYGCGCFVHEKDQDGRFG